MKFVETIQPSSNDILLDIGGHPFNWYRRGGLFKRVDTLNLTLQPMDHIPDSAPEIHALQADARQLAVDDQSNDIVFSNSAIEHVGDFKTESNSPGKLDALANDYGSRHPHDLAP